MAALAGGARAGEGELGRGERGSEVRVERSCCTNKNADGAEYSAMRSGSTPRHQMRSLRVVSCFSCVASSRKPYNTSSRPCG